MYHISQMLEIEALLDLKIFLLTSCQCCSTFRWVVYNLPLGCIGGCWKAGTGGGGINIPIGTGRFIAAV